MDPKIRGLIGIVVGIILMSIGLILTPNINISDNAISSGIITGLTAGGLAGIIVGFCVLTGVIKPKNKKPKY